MTERDDSGTALFRQVVRACRRRRRTVKLADTTGVELSGGMVPARALGLRRLLRRHVFGADERHVGVLLPPTAGAVVTNLALALDRRVTVNLNYTLTSELLNACLAQAGIRHVLTSRRFAERFSFQLDAELVYLEDLRDRPTPVDKLVAALQAYLVPVGLLLRLLRLDRVAAADLLTVIFTSGTTGRPKGVMLTHGNVTANMEDVDHVIDWRPDDVLIGVLPFFHSFGSTITLWSVLARDVKAAYHVNPLEGQAVGKLCREQRGTILTATPMFLRTYLRRCEKEDFATLEVVAVGGEKLPRDLGDAFQQTFGVRPIEGYGTTEMAPLVAANLPPGRAAGDHAILGKEGTVGRPVPGVRAKVVDLESGADLGPGERGMLLVTGPNLMAGYLGQPEATAAVIRDGWYVTGDVAVIDDDGFIELVDRQSRFAKIAGEMVPHAAIEEALTALVGTDEEGGPKVVVTSIPDPAKGERLMVVHTPLAATPDELCRGLDAAGLPNLFIPSRDAFVPVDEFPAIGAGKLDLKRVRQIALEAASARRETATAPARNGAAAEATVPAPPADRVATP
jgi:acyl-[acyl-carrier-protein]-phospholipid O-acyltransferase / long-chain-fatty-acid--[acyl-carrier-protein] ligase